MEQEKKHLLLRTIAHYMPIPHVKNKIKKKLYKNYSMNSGERQVGNSLEKIRRDHIVRYELAVNIIKKLLPNNAINGLDIFCGNGYGAYIIANSISNLKKIVAIDGSKETINFAKKNYFNKKN